MDFFLDGTKGLGLIGQQTVAGSKGTLSIANDDSGHGGNAAVQQFLFASRGASPSSDRAGRFLTLSYEHSALTVANDALANIGKLREEQVHLAEKASTLATGQKTADLQTENDAIEARIQEIKTSATYHGRNVLTSTTYGADVSTTNTHETITVPDATAATSSWALSFASEPTSVTTFLKNVYAKQEAFETIQTGYSDALDKSTTILNNTLVQAAQAPNVVPSVEDAQSLVTDIAYQIGSQFSTEEATKQLIDISFGKADTKKASSLLSYP